MVHRPSGVPQFYQIVQRAREQQVLMWRGPLYRSHPASVGGQGQQHQRAVWWGQETVQKETRTNSAWAEDAATFGARVPQPNVSVWAPWGQALAQRRVGNAVKHLSARLWKRKNSSSNVVHEMKLKPTKFFHRPHLEPRQVLPSVSLTRVVFTAPVSTSHNRIVWSQDALQTSSLSLQRTEDTASLCPERVMRGVWVRVRGEQREHFFTHSVKVSFASDHRCLSSRSPGRLTRVRPSCWVFCFFRGLSEGSSISSASSVGTDNANRGCSFSETHFFWTLICLTTYLLTRSLPSCPTIHCRTVQK